LSDPRRRSAAIGIEQFEDAALTGVVTDLRDSLDLPRAVHRGGAVSVGRVTPFQNRGSQCGDIGAQRDAERVDARLRLAGTSDRKRLFGFSPVEQRNVREEVLIHDKTINHKANSATLLAYNVTWLAVAAVVLSLVGAFYYLRIVKLMYFDEPSDSPRAGAVAPAHPELQMRVLLSANGLVLLLFGIAPSMLMNVCFEVIKAL